jgi:hypothetical protein
MEGRKKLHTDKHKVITNDWNYDASCTLTSLPVWDLENFKRLVFVVQCVQNCTWNAQRPRNRWEDNMDFEETEWEGVN